MFPSFFSSVRVRLLVLLFLAVLPGFALALLLGFEDRQQAMARAQAKALQLARFATLNQERLIEAERQLLATVATLPEVQATGGSTCNARLAELLQKYPRYTNLATVTAQGYVACSGVPFTPQVSVTGRAWFKRALKTHAFAVGDYQVGMITGKATINLAYPILDEANRLQVIIAAALDIGWLNQRLAEAQPPEDTILSIIDPNGTIVAYYPDPERWVGQSVPNTPMVRTMLATGEGVADLLDLDGVARLFAFKPLASAEPYTSLYIAAGISKAAVFAEADWLFIRMLLVVGVIAMFVVTVEVVGAYRLILRPMQALVRATGRVASGDLSARTGLTHSRGELGHLARAFDDMAQALQTRQADATRAEAERQRAVERLELLQQIDHAILTARSSEAIAHAALEHIRTLVACWRVGISLFDFQAQEGLIFANAGPGASPFTPGMRVPLSSYGTQDLAALQAGQNYVVEDVQALTPPSVIASALVLEGARAYTRVPLWWQGQLIGALNLWMDRPGPPAPESLAIAREVADILAVAIQQARLHEQVRRHAAELEARVAERTAELSAANSELAAFSYSVSHDLRAPLRSISGFSQALLEEYENTLDAQGQDYLRRICRATQHMGGLIDALLQLSRVTRAELSRTSVDLTAMARAITEDLRRQHPDRAVACTISPKLTAEGDAQLLWIVLENLLGNAWKFTARQAQASITFGARALDGTVTFFVRDNGAGFDMRYADKLFGAFQRLHRTDEFPGTGVGLATVQRIIHRHGGRIWTEAEVGRGATFYFTL